MKPSSLKFALLFAAVTLTACSINPLYQPSSEDRATQAERAQAMTADDQMPETASDGAVGGSLETAMDVLDKTKMTRALDKPLGKSTEWENVSTGIRYTVVPTQKLTLNGNPFCRKYTITAAKGEKKRELQGTACVGDDGNWKAVSG
ncbi:RT0821/Lpp0805 family surface protein [Aquicella lusitana]|uniref:Outer membrane surface antigen n=1 Tax=Aquicella lusitana TaxID=254246 RepID=A0A370GHU7_9COXI|nr:RT0821/Lpp0805 family surface protein [Aquicella lusitana]RDI43352.1 outer membrane surface antigen [Aquicella lusitana]VVC73502.1 hypothetical protein AQULUS_12450 [Aquicella lusitana]